jgi:hypothetical protein
VTAQEPGASEPSAEAPAPEEPGAAEEPVGQAPADEPAQDGPDEEPAEERPAEKPVEEPPVEKPAEQRPDQPRADKPRARADKGVLAGVLDRLYAHLNVGAQPSSPDILAQGSIPMFEETATFETRGETGGGVLLDVGGGYHLWRRLYGAVSYSRVSGDVGGPLTGQIPDDLIFDSPRPITGSVSGLDHVEHAVHLQAIWRHPINSKIDVGVALGPTIFNVSQDLVSGLQITEGGGSVSLAGTTTERVKDSAVGFNVGVDGSYMLTRRLAAGAFVRYAGGSVDLPGSAGVVSLDVGGVQAGAGIRLRFR